MICLNGRNDGTCFVMELNEAQLEILKEVSKKLEETSVCGCMPTLSVEKIE